MNFSEYIENAWATHGENSAKIAEEFKQHFSLMKTEEDVLAMAQLIVHVCGTHLGEWQKGSEILKKLKNSALIKDRSELNIYTSILILGNDPNSSMDQLPTSAQARVFAGTASALASLGGLKNAEKFLKRAESIVKSELKPEDPAHQALVKASSSIVHMLEKKSQRSSAEDALLSLAKKIV